MNFKFQILSILMLFLVGTTNAQKTESSDSVFYRVMLFNWADSLDVSAQTEVINLFLGMPDKIEGFDTIQINELSKSDEGFDHAFILTFKTEEGLETYNDHPDHLQIQKIAPPLIGGFLLYEYWK